MTLWIFVISTLAVVYCRPQINSHESPAIEVEKQHVVEIQPESKQLFKEDTKTSKLTSEKQLEDSTKEILEKIALVNERQGLNKKKPRPYHPFSYPRSQDSFENRQRTDFKFSRDPFTNPILDYIDRKNDDLLTNTKATVSINPNDEKNANIDDIPPGHYIKRKITHQQTVMVPNPTYLPPNMIPQPQSFYANGNSQFDRQPGSNDMKKNDLEKQTINNIKNIVGNSQYLSTFGYNSYPQQLFNPYLQPPPVYSYQLYGPYLPDQMSPPTRQFQSPLAEYFPIMIKDPIAHFFQALTTMVEYGPQGGSASSDSCKRESDNVKKIEEIKEHKSNEDTSQSRAKQISEKSSGKLTYNVLDGGHGSEITVENHDESNLTTVIDIEDLQITDNLNNPMGLKLNFRKSKDNEETSRSFKSNSSITPEDLLKNPIIETVLISTGNTTSRQQSPPERDQAAFDDELDDDEEEKAEGVQVSHQGTKKLVSKDNTGSGIFVHKIKVRKGGVAIAGPGGIATAGSGGTAIVGPNGFAYTHPDSLAIAGSGTKVIAVEPTINLSEVIMDHNKNKTRGDGHSASRLGKIVAVGPVIYYNKG